MQGETNSGFKYEIDERILSDWDFVMLLPKTGSENPIERLTAVNDIAVMLLGDKGLERLKKHIKSKNDGYCPAAAVETEIVSILQSKPLKN